MQEKDEKIVANFSYFVKHYSYKAYNKWIASVLKLELVWWFVSAKKALVLKKSLRQNYCYTHLFLA